MSTRTQNEKASYDKKWREQNREKHNERRRQYYQENRERFLTGYKERYKRVKSNREDLKRNYGITLEQYNSMFESQGGKCYTCGIPQSELKMALCVDHCHTTGKVRGLLCKKCNSILGYVNDNPEILQNLINYLKIE